VSQLEEIISHKIFHPCNLNYCLFCTTTLSSRIKSILVTKW